MLLRSVKKKWINKEGTEHKEISDLIRRGYIREEGNKLKDACRLISHYGRRYGKESQDIRELFDNEDRFQKNIIEVLKFRLESIGVVDEELRLYVEACISNLEMDPRVCLGNARDFSHTSLRLILDAECPKGEIPKGHLEYWKKETDDRHWPAWLKDGRVPSGENQQRKLLEWLTGTAYLKKVKSRWVTKGTYTQVAHAHELGNYGNHKLGTKPSFLLGVTACFCGLTLLENLYLELPKEQ